MMVDKIKFIGLVQVKSSMNQDAFSAHHEHAINSSHEILFIANESDFLIADKKTNEIKVNIYAAHLHNIPAKIFKIKKIKGRRMNYAVFLHIPRHYSDQLIAGLQADICIYPKIKNDYFIKQPA